MYPWPLRGALHKALFGTVSEDVLEAFPLGSLLVADHDRSISPAPELLPPSDETPGFASQVGVDRGELGGVIDEEEKVVMISQAYRGDDANGVALLGSAEDAEKDLVELRARPEEEATVDGAGGDFDEGLRVWDESLGSAHTL
jgi:hypothetical protein